VVATTPVTIEQAAAILGLSTSTVRRRIRDGRLRAEEVSRPQGIMRLVYLPDDADPGVTQVSAPAGVVTTTAVTSPGDSMIAYTQTLLLPLVEALERSQATVREQAETIGRQSAELERAASIAVKLSDELDAARAQISTLTASGAPQSPDPTTGAPYSRWRFLAPWLLGLLAIVAAVVLLVAR
jgi:excisionase family DNA binding protein